MKNSVRRAARRSSTTLRIFVVCFIVYFMYNINNK